MSCVGTLSTTVIDQLFLEIPKYSLQVPASTLSPHKTTCNTLFCNFFFRETTSCSKESIDMFKYSAIHGICFFAFSNLCTAYLRYILYLGPTISNMTILSRCNKERPCDLDVECVKRDWECSVRVSWSEMIFVWLAEKRESAGVLVRSEYDRSIYCRRERRSEPSLCVYPASTCIPTLLSFSLSIVHCSQSPRYD